MTVYIYNGLELLDAWKFYEGELPAVGDFVHVEDKEFSCCSSKLVQSRSFYKDNTVRLQVT